MEFDSDLRQALSRAKPDSGAQAAPQEGEFDLRRLFATVWRAKWAIAGLGLLGFGLAYLHLMRVPSYYTAEARVLWEYTETNVVDIAPVANNGFAGDFLAMNSQRQLVTSGRLLNRLVEKMNLAEDPVFNARLREEKGWTRYASLGGLFALAGEAIFGPSPPHPPETPEERRQRLIEGLREMIETEWIENSYVMQISATTTDPQRSADLAQKAADLYILDQLEKKFEQTRQATGWLSERVADLRAELEAAEQAVEAFSSGSELVSEDALEAKSRQVKEMRQRIEDQRARMTALESTRAEAEAARAAGDFVEVAALLRDPGLSRLAERLGAELQSDAERDRQIARFDLLFERAMDRLARDHAQLAEQQATLRTKVDELEHTIARQSDALVELRQLEREAEATRLIYESFLTRLKETSVQEEIQRPDARVLSDAQVPKSPSAPNRLALMGIGTTGGVLLGLVLAVLFERMNASFRTADEMLARTGHSVLGTLPLAPVTRRRALLTYLAQKPSSSFAEAVRNLRTSVLLANMDHPPQVIMVSSGLPGEGKTTCCIALAQISRALGKRVLLIECDLRRRTFRNYFNLQEKAGLLSVLSGSRAYNEVVHVDNSTGLHVLPGEQSSVNAADIFSSQRFEDFLSELRKHYDYIIVDTPPVLAVPDARVIAQQADSVIYAVRWNKTPRETVIEGLRLFAQVNVRITGLVLSQVNVKKLARYGYSHYGYYKEAARYYHD